MLSKFFKSHGRMQALRNGPAGSLLESFAQALSERGYATVTAHRHPILRHRSIATTQIYAKVDITALRQIAQPWPEV